MSGFSVQFQGSNWIVFFAVVILSKLSTKTAEQIRPTVAKIIFDSPTARKDLHAAKTDSEF